MGGPCELQAHVIDGADDASAAFVAAEAEVRRLEARYSRYRDDSVTTLINRSAGTESGCVVDAETAALLDFADTAFEQSGGLFDLSSGALRRAWDFKAQRVPEANELAQALACVGWQRVDWQWPRLFLAQGMELDFGGIVKEYAADRAVDVLRAHGVRHGLAELGGDIAIVGPHPDGAPWQVGIRHPRDPGQAIATIPLAHGAIASSGDYERWFETGGTRYCHILNPLTGWPAQGLASASVVAPQCLLAGAASTIAMLKGAQHGPAWLDALGLAHLCVTPGGAVVGALGGA
ncbi:MAG TPA: FAD:protein FMN transferase [Verrucomicrobiae bacterium]|nr:FAD:protein FMN transferase [Verrucomicrobiae bacterium]